MVIISTNNQKTKQTVGSLYEFPLFAELFESGYQNINLIKDPSSRRTALEWVGRSLQWQDPLTYSAFLRVLEKLHGLEKTELYSTDLSFDPEERKSMEKALIQFAQDYGLIRTTARIVDGRFTRVYRLNSNIYLQELKSQLNRILEKANDPKWVESGKYPGTYKELQDEVGKVKSIIYPKPEARQIINEEAERRGFKGPFPRVLVRGSYSNIPEELKEQIGTGQRKKKI